MLVYKLDGMDRYKREANNDECMWNEKENDTHVKDKQKFASALCQKIRNGMVCKWAQFHQMGHNDEVSCKYMHVHVQNYTKRIATE